MKIGVTQLRRIIREEVTNQVAGAGPFKGRLYGALSSDDKASYDRRAAIAGGPSRSFYAKSFKQGTSWVTNVPFIVKDARDNYDMNYMTLQPATDPVLSSNALEKLPAGTMFTVVDDSFGVEQHPLPGGDQPLGTYGVIVEVDGEEYFLSFLTSGRHVTRA